MDSRKIWRDLSPTTLETTRLRDDPCRARTWSGVDGYSSISRSPSLLGSLLMLLPGIEVGVRLDVLVE
jgi:hypothetical protein